MKISKLFLIATSCLMICMAGMSQKKNIFFKRSDNLLFNYGATATATTTDSALTTLATITIGANEVGVIQVTVVGLNDSLGKGLTGSYYARYSKVAGTLTLGSPAAASATVTDAALGTATFSITTSSNNIIVQLKGKAPGYTIRWFGDIKRTYVKKAG